MNGKYADYKSYLTPLCFTKLVNFKSQNSRFGRFANKITPKKYDKSKSLWCGESNGCYW